MKILVITPVYASTTGKSGATPVVHYFAREWAKMGHEVHVFNLCARFPKMYYWITRLFQHQLNNLSGSPVPIECPVEEDFEVDGVFVHRRVMKKTIPHSLYRHSEIRNIVNQLSSYCNEHGVPDLFIGHWHHPQLEILKELKDRFGKKTCLVLHCHINTLTHLYEGRLNSLLSGIDVLGFRNQLALNDYQAHSEFSTPSFIASSGVSADFLRGGKEFSPSFSDGVSEFVYVGLLIARKHPAAIVEALNHAYAGEEYSMTFVGDGKEKSRIESVPNTTGKITFTGRIPREEIIGHLQSAQVFVMISRYEVFGLVYLEAMALGLIPIGSRGEGIDGIIVDGENGFLCEAGNAEELSDIITKIKSLPKEELERISANAKKTAQRFSDSAVAKQYLDNII